MRKRMFFLWIALILCPFLHEPGLAGDNILSLDGEWQFKTDPDKTGMKAEWHRTGLENAAKIKVPELWENAGYKDYDGLGWYELTLTAPEQTGTKKTALKFYSVDDSCLVWLDGKPLGGHHGWNTPFFFDLTGILKASSQYRLTVLVTDEGGGGGIYKPVRLESYADKSELYETEWYRNHNARMPAPAPGLNIYEVFLRTATGSGTIREFMQEIPRLSALGVKALWIMPVHPVGKVKRKGDSGSPYAVSDYYAVNPEFGSLEDFKKLVLLSHKNGMKIIIDLVANHSAWDNPLTAQHPDWYNKNQKGEIVSPNESWDDVADFNYDIPELNTYISDMMCWWLTEGGIDGFRCDVAEAVPHSFWNMARQKMDEKKHGVVMLAESGGQEPLLNGFDMVYDDGFYHHIVEVCQDRMPASALSEYLAYGKYNYPKNSLRMTFIENHDKERASNVLGKNRLYAAAAVLFTAEGVPLVYQGQEYGLSEPRDIFNRHTLDWQKADKAIFELYKKLFVLRESNAALKQGETLPVEVSPSTKVCAYERKYRQERILTLANFGDKSEEIILSDASLVSAFFRQDKTAVKSGIVDLLGSPVQVKPAASKNAVILSLPAGRAFILKSSKK